MKLIRCLIALAVVICLAGCLPIATATIHIGNGFTMDDMEKAEAVIEQLGFVRRWMEPPDKPRVKRADRADKFVSVFELQRGAYGAGVTLRKRDGNLEVGFGERNDHISPEGRAILNELVQQLRTTFGDAVEWTEP